MPDFLADWNWTVYIAVFVIGLAFMVVRLARRIATLEARLAELEDAANRLGRTRR